MLIETKNIPAKTTGFAHSTGTFYFPNPNGLFPEIKKGKIEFGNYNCELPQEIWDAIEDAMKAKIESLPVVDGVTITVKIVTKKEE